MEKEKIIEITGLKKRYRLGTIGGGTLQADIQSWWARVRKKEDPNLKIGQKRHGKNEIFMALDGIDITIYKGERVGIIGHNGAGKSTLLKLLSRVTAPTEGKICFNGRISSMLEVGTGFNGELTGRENIYLNGSILGMTKKEIDEKIDDIIEFSECRQFIDTPVKRYSSGMFVKLAFSVAAHLDNEILIMDEVLAVGDMAFQRKCLEKMKDVSMAENRTVLYVSHNMNTIQQLCDRCIVLDHGKVRYDGDVSTAIDIYADISSYMNVEMDFSEMPRRFMKEKGDFYLLKAGYEGKLTGSFYKNEKMKLNLKWENVNDVNNICFRMEIKSTSSVPICSYVVDNFYSGKKGKIAEAMFEIDLSSLVPGQYLATYSFYYKNEYAGTQGVDNVRGMAFEIMEGNEENYMKWNSQLWGYMQVEPAPTFTIIKEEDKEEN